jgi:hypothetical protein
MQVVRGETAPAPLVLGFIKGILCGGAASLTMLKTATARRPAGW